MPGPWVRNELWRRAQAVPSLDLRFAENKSLTDAVTGQSLITFTRASSATYIDSAGTLRTAAVDVPRFDHNPTTGESLGLLVEDQRTNSIRNNTMVGAVAGTPGTLPTNWSISGGGIGTLTQEVVAIGTSNGIAYVDVKYSGTSSNTGFRIFTETTGQTTASTGQVWTASLYAALLSGSTGLTSLSCDIVGRANTGAIIETPGSISIIPTTTLTRYAVTGTLAQASTVSVQQAITINYLSGVVVDFTLRIGLPQLELGAFATSVIPTSTAAATRNADVASITGANFSSWYRQDEGTVYCQGLIPPGLSSFPTFHNVSDASANNNFGQYAHTSGLYANLRTGNVSQGDPGVQISPVVGAAYRLSTGFATNNLRTAWNGTIGTPDTLASMPTALSELRIGANRIGAFAINTTISRLAYWPTRLPDSTLQAITQ
jgi:hypothetical protein